MFVRGIVSKAIPSKGTFDTPDGRSIDYDHDIITLLVDGLDPVEVKIKRAQALALGGPFVRGQEVELEVSVPKGVRLDFLSLAAPAPAGK